MSVHSTHCCVKHGCKYGDEDCTVELGTETGIICEACEWERERMEEKENVLEDRLARIEQMIQNLSSAIQHVRNGTQS